MKDIYSKFRKQLNNRQKGQLSKLVYYFMNLPTVKVDAIDPSKKFPNGEPGGLIISADFEMAWAWRYAKTGDDPLVKGQAERENFPGILEILEKFNIPITFATVGHLFLEQCEKGQHNWMRRIPHFNDHWKFTNGDWFDHDPCSNFKDAPEWYAPDLIQMILDSKVEHEIATHTFSHIDFSYKNCPPPVAHDEMKACREAAKPFGVDLTSIVFPGGTWGNIEAVKDHEIQIYRRHVEYDLAYPYRDEHGLLVTPSSGCLEYNLTYGWSPEYYMKRLKRYVDKAIRTHTIVHLWFHPSLNPFLLKKVFPLFLDYVSWQRQMGRLWIGTMKEISRHIHENHIV